MTIQRNRRQRKKLHLGEFTEVGFTINFTFPENTPEQSIDEVVDTLIAEVIVPEGLVFDGCGYMKWQGLIGPKNVGYCTEQQQTMIKQWLEAKGLLEVSTSELFDLWWD